MGIKDNFAKIIDYQRKKNIETKMNREVIKQSIEETRFYKEYSSFVVGLRSKLNNLLVRDGNLEVVFRPNKHEDVKYFERAMEDNEFNIAYNIRRTVGGEYVFRQKTIKDELEKLDYEDFV